MDFYDNLKVIFMKSGTNSSGLPGKSDDLTSCPTGC